jgi:hypothetical protein
MSSGTATVLLFVPIVVWAYVTQVWLISICRRKRKPVLARLGWIGLVVPGLFVFPLVGASRLAKPSSQWAVLHYGDDFLGLAARRYPDDHDVMHFFSLPRPDRTVWEKTMIAGLIATAAALVLLFGETDYAGLAAVCMLGELVAITWLAEVELTAKPYSRRGIRVESPEPEPVPVVQ